MAEQVDGGASVTPGAVRLRLLEAQGDPLSSLRKDMTADTNGSTLSAV